jgi:hypothetical protein
MCLSNATCTATTRASREEAEEEEDKGGNHANANAKNDDLKRTICRTDSRR